MYEFSQQVLLLLAREPSLQNTMLIEFNCNLIRQDKISLTQNVVKVSNINRAIPYHSKAHGSKTFKTILILHYPYVNLTDFYSENHIMLCCALAKVYKIDKVEETPYGLSGCLSETDIKKVENVMGSLYDRQLGGFT